jgi:hypothetical protein
MRGMQVSNDPERDRLVIERDKASESFYELTGLWSSAFSRLRKAREALFDHDSYEAKPRGKL